MSSCDWAVAEGQTRSNDDDRTSRGDRLGAAGRRRPRAVGGHPRRDGSAALEDRAHRQRELHVRRGDGGPGLASHEQVRGRPAGQALLRRLRVRGRGRAAGTGSGPGPLPRRRARERPAPLRRAGQHGRLPLRPRDRRQDPGHEPGPWRPSDPRLAGQLQRQVVRGPRLRRRSADRADRLRRSRAPGRRSQAEDDRRRRQRLPAHDRFRAPRQDRPRQRRLPVRRHGPHRGARGGGTASRRRSATRTSSRRRPTRRSAARAAASSSAARTWARPSTSPSSPAPRAAR